MIRCGIILPYFGKFNNYFPIFLKSCSYNKKFDWLIFTDDKTDYEYPENVQVYYLSFDDIVCLVQSKFDFKICLDKPYKLCDFKAAYGLIFQDYLKEYDFWGFCDCDLIFGDLSKFLTDDIFKDYDRIFSLGHLSLFRNSDVINRMCMNDYHGIFYAKKVFSSNEIYGFDEMVLNTILKLNGKKIYTLDLSANISVYYHKFRLVKREYSINRYIIENYIPAIYVWDKGRVLRFFISDDDGLFTINEFAYIHLQQREMMLRENIYNLDSFQILPNELKKIDKKIIDCSNFKSIKKYNFNFSSQKKCFCNLIRWKVKTLLNHVFPTKFLRGNI